MKLDLTKAATSPAWLVERTPPTCLLCGEPTAYAGIWTNDGRPAVLYGLCRDHAADLDAGRIETLITARLGLN
ncbi:MAG: hypothetical protein GXY55_09785 [Phycisphaerae bacterium]|nr:hypothetical protein [Phycisphaerae bacterium]